MVNRRIRLLRLICGLVVSIALLAGYGCQGRETTVVKTGEQKKITVDPGLTFEDQQIQSAHFLEKLNIPAQKLDRDALESEIAEFLKQVQCLTLATINPDGTPHQTILDYVSDGTTIYIASAGGQKFVNLAHSNKVSVAIGYTGGTVESEYGLTIDGTAEVFKAPHPMFMAGMMKMRGFLQEWSKSVQPMEDILKKVVTARVIKITPERMTYMNMPKGIAWARWEK